MSDSFVQGISGSKLKIPNFVESFANALISIPANSFMFSPKTGQFCKGYCAEKLCV